MGERGYEVIIDAQILPGSKRDSACLRHLVVIDRVRAGGYIVIRRGCWCEFDAPKLSDRLRELGMRS